MTVPIASPGGILLQPDLWQDENATVPPISWGAVDQAVTVSTAAPKATQFTGTIALPNLTPVVLSGTPPTGFSLGTTYYVVALPAISEFTFALSASKGGTPITATDDGTSVRVHDARFAFKGDPYFDKVQLLLHMDGTNGGTTFTDSSNFANTVTSGNGYVTTSTAQVKYGSAAAAFGSNDYLSTTLANGNPAAADLTTDCTIEGWGYFNNIPAGTQIFCSFGAFNGANAIGLVISAHNYGVDPRLEIYGTDFLGNPVFQIDGTYPSPSTGAWHHMALERVSGTWTFYLDGASIGSSVQTGLAVNSSTFCIGGNAYTGAHDYMDGYVDELRYTLGVARYKGNFTPPPAAFPNEIGSYNTVYIGNSLADGDRRSGLFGTARLGYQVVTPTASASLQLTYDLGAGAVTVPLTNTAGASGVVSVDLDGATQFTWGLVPPTAQDAVVLIGEAPGDTTYGNVNFNCATPDENTDFQTLAQLRRRMMVRLGYAAQADNPPPGMPDLLTEFLQSAQRTLFKRYPARFERRFFRWTMQANDRFYGIKSNDEDTYRNLRADFTKGIQWSGIKDSRGTWTPIFEGIMPELYTMVTQLGRPVRYEIRDCIEVFPAPDGPYELWLKAQISLQAFSADSDQTTIDSEVVFLHALAMAKKHYGAADADATQAEANTYLSELVAGTHLNKRYVPGAHPVAPIVKPALITFQDGS